MVALEQAVAAPFASSRLADAGARVIKVERPGGGDFARRYDDMARGQSTHFVWLNRGKESIVLDVKDHDDHALLLAMIAKADVFIQNLAPGTAKRLGLGSDGLRQRYPKLITCDISGYGESGPLSKAKAYDLLVQCESGLASLTGSPDAPGRVGVSVCDIATGMAAHAGIVEALVEQQKTGRGRGLAISMFDTMADWMAVPLLAHDYAGRTMERLGLNHPSLCPYGAFACQDGSLIVIAIQNEDEWQRFCAAILKDATLATDPRFDNTMARLEHRAALENIIRETFAQRSRKDLQVSLASARIACGAVNEVADLSSHSQLNRVAVETPAGPISYGAPPVRRSDEQLTLGPVPALGAHSNALRKEFTNTADET